MSAIRPQIPTPLFPTQVPGSPARSSRSDFFRAALEGVQAPTQAAAAPTTAVVPTDTPVRAIPSTRPDLAEFRRPGSLLDIRI